MRLPKLMPAELTTEQTSLYEAIATGPRAAGPQLFQLTDADGCLEGPFNGMLYDPPTGVALQALGTAVRYGTVFTDREREIAILVVAAHWGSDFEQYAHEAVGRAAGLSESELTAIRTLDLDRFSNSTERMVATLALALARGGEFDEDAYEAAVRGLGLRRFVVLTTLVGYYATLALQLRVFGVSVPD